MDTVLGIGLQGMSQGLERLSRDAQRVTEAFTPNSSQDPVSAFVDLQQDALAVKAGAAVIRSGAELYRYSLDILA